jgi:Flp pilus assembly protein TadG
MRRLRSFFADQSAATAAEFALVLPVALLFLFGIFDVGRYFWSINRLEKAVQVGTRYAVATKIVSNDLNNLDYSGFDCGSGGLNAGDKICKDALGRIVCTANNAGAVTCTCTNSSLGAGSCPADLGDVDTAAFTSIVNRIRVIAPQVDSNDVRVIYTGSGIGYVGDPRKDDEGNPLSQISPVVTVQVINQRVRAMSLMGLGLSMPSFQYSQLLEDGEGAIAY